MDLFGTKAKVELKEVEARLVAAEAARDEATARANALNDTLKEGEAYTASLQQAIRELLEKNMPPRAVKDKARALLPTEVPTA